MKANQLQKNIPSGWQIKQFKDCVIILAKLKGLKNSEYKNFGKYPIFDQAQEYISGYSDEEKLLNKNYPAILFGDHTRIIKYIKSPFISGADGAKIFWSKNDIDSAFLYYSLFNLNIPNTGYNRHFKFLKESMILVPNNISEQKKIAEILSKVDEETNKIDELISKTEKFKNGLMNDLFTKGVRHKKFKKTELGDIPEEWEIKTLADIGENVIGLTYSPSEVVSEGMLVLRSSNIFENKIIYKDNVFINKKVPQHLITKIGDILLCTRNGSRNLIGKNAYIDKKSAGHSFGAFMSVYRTEYNKFVFQFFQSRFFKEQVNKYLGSTINQITTKSLNSFILPIPSIREQSKIAEVLLSVDKKLEKQKELKEKLIQLKKGLMSDLLRGKVRTIKA